MTFRAFVRMFIYHLQAEAAARFRQLHAAALRGEWHSRYVVIYSSDFDLNPSNQDMCAIARIPRPGLKGLHARLAVSIVKKRTRLPSKGMPMASKISFAAFKVFDAEMNEFTGASTISTREAKQAAFDPVQCRWGSLQKKLQAMTRNPRRMARRTLCWCLQ